MQMGCEGWRDWDVGVVSVVYRYRPMESLELASVWQGAVALRPASRFELDNHGHRDVRY